MIDKSVTLSDSGSLRQPRCRTLVRPGDQRLLSFWYNWNAFTPAPSRAAMPCD